MAGTGEVRYRIPRLPLLPGRYVLSVSAYDQDLSFAYDHRERVATFTVVEGGTLERFGLITLDGTWTLDPAERSLTRTPAVSTRTLSVDPARARLAGTGLAGRLLRSVLAGARRAPVRRRVVELLEARDEDAAARGRRSRHRRRGADGRAATCCSSSRPAARGTRDCWPSS